MLSTPRVSTQNNVEAEITQGVQIPIQTVANNTVTVSFKDAALTLKVTPQITAADTVIMKIALENASAGLQPVGERHSAHQHPAREHAGARERRPDHGDRRHLRQPGAVAERSDARALSQVPLLKWLFKRDQVSDRAPELLIFITPKITKDLIMRRTLQHVAIASAVLASVSCGDVVRDKPRAGGPVVNTLEAAPSGGHGANTFTGTLLSDVVVLSTAAPCSATAPCATVFNDLGRVVLGIAPKNITVTPTSNNQVTISRYHVDFIRADRHNIAARRRAVSVRRRGHRHRAGERHLTLSFELVRHTAKEESPLAQLASNPAIIHAIARITFYGQDLVGNAISVTGSMNVDFGNSGTHEDTRSFDSSLSRPRSGPRPASTRPRSRGCRDLRRSRRLSGCRPFPTASTRMAHRSRRCRSRRSARPARR